ncbi:MAG: hypothetical protein AAGE01_16645 [Pseudomonadota bacterium]
MKRLLPALILLLAAPLATAQSYVFHDQFKGIYATPELPGWGFAADIQKGILFVAVFGYDESGDEAFLTFISDKVPTDNIFSFAGAVFLTDSNGTRTEQVGTFTWNTIAIDGQPGASINVDSPFLEASNLRISRFGFVEDDPLDVMEGKTIGLLLTGPLPGASIYATQLGNYVDFNRPRLAFEDGTPFLPGIGLGADISAGFLFDPNLGAYELLIVDGDETVAYRWTLVSHTSLQGTAFSFINGESSPTVPGFGVYISELVDAPVRKENASVDIDALQRAYAALREAR